MYYFIYKVVLGLFQGPSLSSSVWGYKNQAQAVNIFTKQNNIDPIIVGLFLLKQTVTSQNIGETTHT